MAEGLSGSFILNESNEFKCRVSWSETYDSAENTHIVSITKLEIASSTYSGYEYFVGGKDEESDIGYISISGTRVIEFNNVLGTHKVYVQAKDTYHSVEASGTYSDPPWTLNTPISGNSDGTCSVTVSVHFSGRSNLIGDGSPWHIDGSANIVLTTIPRASGITSANLVIGEESYVIFTPALSSFCYKLRYKYGSQFYTTSIIQPKRTNSFKYSFVISEDIAQEIPYDETCEMELTLYTYSDSTGSELIGSLTKTHTATLSSKIVPKITNFQTSIVNDNAVINEWGIAVSGYTKVRIDAMLQPGLGAYIESFYIPHYKKTELFGDEVVRKNYSYTGGALEKSGTTRFDCTLTDSRGRSYTFLDPNSITFYHHEAPRISSFIVRRNPDDQLTMLAKASWTFSSVNGKNSAIGTVYYKKAAETTWSFYGEIQNNTSVTLKLNEGFDETSSYEFQLVVEDAIGASSQTKGSATTSRVLIDLRAGGKGLAIGKISESDSLEIALPSNYSESVTFRSDVYIGDVPLADYIASIVNEIVNRT